MQIRFPRTFGQEPAKDWLRGALASGRFPHALLLHGEPGLGQHALLLDLAQILSCASEREKPCGKCPACRAFDRSALETLHYLIPLSSKEKQKERDSDGQDGETPALGAAQVDELAGQIALWHSKPYAFSAPGKAMVRVSQARELLARLGFAANAGTRLVLVPYLEDLNLESANALLKTLEEPPEGVHFLMASERRSSLLPTLLSRSSQLGLSPLPPEVLQEAARSLASPEEAARIARLLPFAEGSLGSLMGWLENGEELLAQTARFLAAAAAPDWRLFAEYVSEPTGEGAEDTLALLQFLLRAVRLHHGLRAEKPGTALGREHGYRFTAESLKARGWDPALAETLESLEDIPDLSRFAAYLERAHRAVKANCRPQSALLGLYLEYAAAPAAAA